MVTVKKTKTTAFVLGFLLFLIRLFTCVSAESTSCGYQSCPVSQSSLLNVHLIAHTHDDVGWLKTFDQYFYGSKTNLARAGVQYILDSVIEELKLDKNRKFIYVETSFFSCWWNKLSTQTKQDVINLVQSGQLEFIGGGWSMNDEAAAHYNDIIDQMTVGLRTLQDLFQSCGVPKVAWQIDPFGHSRQQASLFAQMAFDGLFVGRIDYQDKDARLSEKNMEFVWNTSSSLQGVGSQLFTGVLFNTYSPPANFCFDILCNDEPIIDDKNIPDYNVDKRVNEFLTYVKNQAQFYQSNNIAITMGNDFNYQSAVSWFTNLDKLIKYTNARQQTGSNVNVFYSTPSCYLQALKNSHVTWNVSKNDDFFPYASDPHAYWTGYFTSRPALKGFIRRTNNFLQICKQLDALTFTNPQRTTTTKDVDYLREAQGVAQHHDAVTGTSKQVVAYDYARLLSIGVSHCEDVINDAYGLLLTNGNDNETPKQKFCHKLNVSQCHVTEQSHQFTVTVYNPIGRPISTPIRLPINDNKFNYIVLDSSGKSIDTQIVDIPPAVKNLPERNSSALYELVFIAKDVPALGFASYYVKPRKTLRLWNRQGRIVNKMPAPDDLVIANDFLRVTVDKTSGLLKEVANLEENVTVPVSQNFFWYRAMSGSNKNFSDRASGAYIFRPNGTATPFTNNVGSAITVFRGDVVSEIFQTFTTNVTQVIRLYANARHVELEWLVGPIPVYDKVGKEVITRFTTNLKTDGKFYTDSNGREILQRVRNYRPTWNLNVTEPISGNYYPATNQAFIKGKGPDFAQLTILTDRSEGVSSVEDGSIEAMVHRRLLYDDAFGVNEALDEPGVDGEGLRVRGKTMLLVNAQKMAAAAHRDLAQKMTLSPLVTLMDTQLTYQEWASKFIINYSGLQKSLPPNIHLLTLEVFNRTTFLLRLEHFYEALDDPKNLSLPVKIDLQSLFKNLTFKSVQEMTLAANQKLSSYEPPNWNKMENEIPKKPRMHRQKDQKATTNQDELLYNKILLKPMQIRTFIIQVQSL